MTATSRRGSAIAEANLREHCSWVTPGDRPAATRKAKAIVRVAVARDDVREDLRRRDERDRTRADSPLRPADGAHVLDTTGLSLDQEIEAPGFDVELDDIAVAHRDRRHGRRPRAG